MDLAADPRVAAASRLGAGAWAARRSDGVLLRRWLGCWIDFLAMAALFVVGAALGSEISKTAGVIAAVLPVIAYFPLTEGLWGRSLGKLITGTMVVNAEGDRPGFGRAMVRTLTRLVEVNPFLFGGVPAGLIAAFTPRHQRLGDLLAGTYVVAAADLAEARARLADPSLAAIREPPVTPPEQPPS